MTYTGRPARAWAEIRLSANQTTNIAANNHIEFDQIFGVGHTGLISLATGAGQADGIITLSAGYYYVVYCSVGAQPNEGQIQFRWENHPGDDVVIGVEGVAARTMIATDSGTAGDASSSTTDCIVIDCTTTPATIKLELTSVAIGAHVLWRAGSRVFIEVLN